MIEFHRDISRVLTQKLAFLCVLPVTWPSVRRNRQSPAGRSQQPDSSMAFTTLYGRY
jgi:hypothetical protein